MTHKRTEMGFSHTLLIGAIVIVTILGFVAYRVVNNQDSATPTASQKSSTIAAPSTIESSDDLSRTQAAVNDTSVESDLNPADLNEDVNSLL